MMRNGLTDHARAAGTHLWQYRGDSGTLTAGLVPHRPSCKIAPRGWHPAKIRDHSTPLLAKSPAEFPYRYTGVRFRVDHRHGLDPMWKTPRWALQTGRGRSGDTQSLWELIEVQQNNVGQRQTPAVMITLWALATVVGSVKARSPQGPRGYTCSDIYREGG